MLMNQTKPTPKCFCFYYHYQQHHLPGCCPFNFSIVASFLFSFQYFFLNPLQFMLVLSNFTTPYCATSTSLQDVANYNLQLTLQSICTYQYYIIGVKLIILLQEIFSNPTFYPKWGKNGVMIFVYIYIYFGPSVSSQSPSSSPLCLS